MDQPRIEQLWQPATFQERGVAVPFTTPAMAGARARGASRGVELIVPHPAGVRGVYLMTWSEVGNFCAATLHDLRLADRLGSLELVSPCIIRSLARGVAAEGVAGRAARDAARRAADSEHTLRLMTNIALLQALVQQETGAPCPMAELDRSAKAAILRLAPRLGRPPEAITNDIEALSRLYAPIGLGATSGRAGNATLIDAIAGLVHTVREVGDPADTRAGLGTGLVLSAAEVTLLLARRLLDEARARAGDMEGLLAGWIRDPVGTEAYLARLDWLLDGWEQICLVWQLATSARQRGCLSEMAMMVPAIPLEAEKWLGTAVDDGERQRLRKLVNGFEDWRTGSLVFDLIARNERIRALAA